GVIARGGAIIAEQGRNRLSSVSGIRQQANRLLVRFVGHHVGLGDLAVVAAQAEQNAANFLAPAGDAGGQKLRVFPSIAECNGLAIQWAGILAPQCITTGIGAATVTGTERAAMRSMAARAAAALVVVGTQDVNC